MFYRPKLQKKQVSLRKANDVKPQSLYKATFPKENIRWPIPSLKKNDFLCEKTMCLTGTTEKPKNQQSLEPQLAKTP